MVAVVCVVPGQREASVIKPTLIAREAVDTIIETPVGTVQQHRKLQPPN